VQCSAHDVAQLSNIGWMHLTGAYSSFGALNCEPDLGRVAGALAALMPPDAPLVLSVMNRWCLWELAWYLAHGQPRRAMRRLDRGALEDVPEGEVLTTFLVRYYLPRPWRARLALLPFAPADETALGEALAPARWSAPARGHGKRLTDLADHNARHLLETLRLESFEGAERADDPVYALGRDLGMSAVPRSLVCADISTAQGKDTVGSIVWFENGRPRRAEYRTYRMKTVEGQDDFASLREMVGRFFRRRLEEQQPLPDLFVVDGGRGQLGAALEAAAQHAVTGPPTWFASLAKRDEEIFLPGRSEPLRLPRRSPSLKLLQRARDEAHRTAVTFGRRRRTARTITSQLLAIPGVGPSRRRVLLERFGSLAGVRSASVAELGSRSACRTPPTTTTRASIRFRWAPSTRSARTS